MILELLWVGGNTVFDGILIKFGQKFFQNADLMVNVLQVTEFRTK